MSALFLELARTLLFLSSSSLMFKLMMISSIVVLAPHEEVARAPPVARLATHKLLVSLDSVVGLELLATTLAIKILCWLGVGKGLKALSQTVQGQTF